MSATEHSFGEHEPLSLGLEEELFVVDPASGHLRNAAPDLVARLGAREEGSVKSELHRSQVELVTGVHATVGEAVAELQRLRRAVLGTGVGLIASGTHPTAIEGDSIVTPSPRYERIAQLLGDAGATPVCALHVHVGMPDPESAIRVFNGLRRHLPVIEALSANSPYRHGRDTGLASARELTLRSWPRAGVPRAMVDYADFVRSTARLTRVAEVPDYTYHWWKLRPHPRLGTVEVRALDTQAAPGHAAALVALVHALAGHLVAGAPGPDPAPEILDEASFRAARDGVEATLPDARLRLRPVRELAAELVEALRPVAARLGCADELAGLGELIDIGGGAGAQRAAGAERGADAARAALLVRAPAHDRGPTSPLRWSAGERAPAKP